MALDKKKAIGRVTAVFIISIVIWRLMLLFFGGAALGENIFRHIAAGIFTSVLVCILIFAIDHIEKKKMALSWNIFFGNLKGFGSGFLCWIIPAVISISIFAIAGFVTIQPQVSSATLISQAFILFAAVFLIEAFPEEIIRGYIFSSLEEHYSPWVALFVQTVLFTLFAFFIGSLYSQEQLLFIPGFGFLLGYFRMLSRSISFSMGFHAALMTFTQLLAPSRQLLEANGSFFVLRFLSFVLLPAIFSSVILHLKMERSKV